MLSDFATIPSFSFHHCCSSRRRAPSSNICCLFLCVKSLSTSLCASYISYTLSDTVAAITRPFMFSLTRPLSTHPLSTRPLTNSPTHPFEKPPLCLIVIHPSPPSPAVYNTGQGHREYPPQPEHFTIPVLLVRKRRKKHPFWRCVGGQAATKLVVASSTFWPHTPTSTLATLHNPPLSHQKGVQHSTESSTNIHTTLHIIIIITTLHTIVTTLYTLHTLLLT